MLWTDSWIWFQCQKEKICLQYWEMKLRSTEAGIQTCPHLLKSHFGMGVLLSICCIFSEHVFLRTPSWRAASRSTSCHSQIWLDFLQTTNVIFGCNNSIVSRIKDANPSCIVVKCVSLNCFKCYPCFKNTAKMYWSTGTRYLKLIFTTS